MTMRCTNIAWCLRWADRDHLCAHRHARSRRRVLARSFEGLARQAREEGWTHEEYLYEVLGAEFASSSAVTGTG